MGGRIQGTDFLRRARLLGLEKGGVEKRMGGVGRWRSKKDIKEGEGENRGRRWVL